MTTGTLIQRLGASPVINAYETVTAYGGSIMPNSVREAMDAAAEHFVDVEELNRRAGAHISQLVGVESATVTAGCAAGLALSVAASITGDDDAAISRFSPARDSLPAVLVHRCQRNPYDSALTLPGTRIVEFGYPTHAATLQQLEAAFESQPVCVIYFAGALFERYAVPLPEVAAACKARNIPLIVDGAAQLPPRKNLTRFLELGADAAIFSGGKGIRGPQETGIVLGRTWLTAAIRKLSCPRHGFGRPMKLSKEGIAGVVAALEHFLSLDEEGEYQRMLRLAQHFCTKLQSLGNGYGTVVLPTGRHGQRYPRISVEPCIEGAAAPAARHALMRLLREGAPAIIVGPRDEHPGAIAVNLYAVTEADVDTICDRLHEIDRSGELREATRSEAPEVSEPGEGAP